MDRLIEFIRAHSIKGACTCDQCLPSTTDTTKPVLLPNHTTDLVLFPVTLNQDNLPSAKAFIELIRFNQQGMNLRLDLFDGRRHNHFQIGCWIGDHALALRLMGMGALLNLWTLITPLTEFPNLATNKEAAIKLATNGFLFLQTTSPDHIKRAAQDTSI